MRVAAFILARAGSKGLPGKNIIPLMGRPLINWTIDAALKCADVDRTIVSTDGEEIAKVARAAGAEVMMRPDELAGDAALPKDAIRYHLDAISKADATPDITVLLQPTSPLRIAADISACLAPVLSGEKDSAATFVKASTNPYRAWRQTEDGVEPFIEGADPFKPRQQLPDAYALNGAVYAVRTDVFLADQTHSFLPGRNAMVVMPAERSIDIDVALDLAVTEALLKAGAKEI